MNVTVERHLRCNITVVLDKLELASISRDKIRAAIDQAVLMDVPELLMVVAPPSAVVQVTERRVVSEDRSGSAPGKIDLWSPLLAVLSAVDEPQVVAYGFNYSVVMTLQGSESAGETLTRVFLPTAGTLKQTWGVEGLSSIPWVAYNRGSVRYDLRLEPKDGAAVRAHLNVHIARDSLPDAAALEESFVAQVDEIGRVLGAL